MNEQSLFWWLGQHLLLTAALAVIVTGLCRWLKPQPFVRHLMWFMVLCRLMTPPIATWPWALPIEIRPSSNVIGSTETQPFELELIATSIDVVDVEYSSGVEGAADESSKMEGQPAAPQELRQVEATSNAAESMLPALETLVSQISIGWAVVFVWAVGAVLSLALLAKRIFIVSRTLPTSSEHIGWLNEDLAQWCDELQISQPKCIVSDQIKSPFLWCYGQTRLYWPKSLTDQACRDRAQPILIHELAHLKRKDHWTAWLEAAGLGVWWWNPMFWWVRRQMRVAAEMACDRWAIEMLPDQRRDFAESLIEFSRQSRGELALGVVGAGSRKTFERRLKMIMSEDRWGKFSKSTLLVGVLVAAVSMPSFAVAQKKAKAKTTAESTKQTKKIEKSKSNETKDAALAKHVATFNKLMTERKYADAAIVAKQAYELDRQNPVVMNMLVKVKLALRNNPKLGPPSASKDKNTVASKKHSKIEVSQNSKTVKKIESKTTRLETLREIVDRIEGQYYGDIDRRAIEQAAIKAIVESLDDYSTVLSPDEFQKMTINVDGGLVGVGVGLDIDKERKQPVVTKVIWQAPAAKAGVRRGDIIESIDGTATKDATLGEIIKQLRGKQGTKVTVGVRRGEESVVFKVTRNRFELASVNPWSMTDDGKANHWADQKAGIGYVHIPSFSRNTAKQFQNVVSGLQKNGMKSLVIHLRNCGGGLLDAATRIADMFLDGGTIVSSAGRDAKESMTITAKPGGEFVDLPVAVLVNDLTASAAEILAASLQDHHRAVMVGQQTFGRGTVQKLFPLKDGGALKLTISTWLRPNGKSLLKVEGSKKWGVQPNAGFGVAVSPEVRKQLAQQQQLRLNGDKVENAVDDTQLDRAIKFLKLG